MCLRWYLELNCLVIICAFNFYLTRLCITIQGVVIDMIILTFIREQIEPFEQHIVMGCQNDLLPVA